MKLHQTILLLIALSMVAALVACSSSSTPPPPPVISVALSGTPPTSLQTNAVQAFTATVTNDSANAGVTWSVTCGSSGACGSFDHTSTASGAATNYTAPSAVPTGNTVTVTATSVTDSTKSASAIVTITAPPVIAVTLGPAPSSLQVLGGAGITAFVANDSANAGVTWTVACGSAGACGSLSASSTASGAPTDYTAPSAVPTGNTVTLTATSVTDNTKTASAVITITTANTTLADGTYVFSLAGQDYYTGFLYYAAGAFTVSSGAITGGEQDFVDFSTNTLLNNIIGGSVTTTADGNLQITLNTDDTTGTVGVAGTETLNATLVSASRGLINEFDASATSSGTLDLQTSTSVGLGGYAFYVTGGDSNYYPATFGGVINVDGSGTISGAGSVFDINDVGNVLQNQPINPSTVSSADSFGRIQISLDLTTSGVGGLGLAGYVVDGNRIRLVENSNDVNDIFFGVTGGTAFYQGANTGTFSAASIAGSSFVFGTNGQDPNGYFQAAGVLTTNADGTTVNGTLNENDLTGTGAQAPIPFTGTYTVDATGRVTLSNQVSGNTVTVQLYLDGSGNGLVATMDNFDVLAGLAYLQTGGGSFSAASCFGTYGFDATGFDLTYTEVDSVGPVVADGVGTLTGTVDQNYLFNWQTVGLSLAGTFTADPSGIFSDGMTGLDVTSPLNTDAFTYYVIDTTRVVAIETDPNELTLGYFELQQ